MFELMNTKTEENAVIKVIGVGGGGSNAVQHMLGANIEGVDFICANTDAQALKTCAVPITLQMGVNITKGLGAGANPDVGRQAGELGVGEGLGNRHQGDRHAGQQVGPQAGGVEAPAPGEEGQEAVHADVSGAGTDSGQNEARIVSRRRDDRAKVARRMNRNAADGKPVGDAPDRLS